MELRIAVNHIGAHHKFLVEITDELDCEFVNSQLVSDEPLKTSLMESSLMEWFRFAKASHLELAESKFKNL